MYINQIDDLFDGIINNLNQYLIKNKLFDKLKSDTNFVKFQNDILDNIKKFIDTIDKDDIKTIIKNDSYVENILNIIKRYCAFYIYLGIGYYYDGNRDLYITNILESAKYQKDSTFQIPNFYNTENNSKIIKFYNDIKNFIGLINLKTIDKIKIVLLNNPLKYDTTIKLFNELGEDYITEFFLIENNFHNIIKTIIFRQIYLKEEKESILEMLNQVEKDNIEYKYIDIVVSTEKKIVDFNIIQKFLSSENFNIGMAEEIYDYLVENNENIDITMKDRMDYINYLFNNNVLVPITEEFLRYHKDSEKYGNEKSSDTKSRKEQQDTKIKYIINKMNYVKNYYSPLLDKNTDLKINIMNYIYKQLDPKMATLYNNDEEIKIIRKLEMSEQTVDLDLLVDLYNIRKYAFVNFKNFSQDGFKFRPNNTIEAIRSITMKEKKTELLNTRIGHSNIDLNIIGIAFNPSKQLLGCFKTQDLVDVKTITKNDNGFESFQKVMNKTFDSNSDKLYYWLFDVEKDKIKANKYLDLNTNDPAHNIKLMIEQLYNNYIELVKNKFVNYINNVDEITSWNYFNLLKGYEQKFFNFNLEPSLRNELNKLVLQEKIKDIDVEPDEIDSMIPGKREDLITLPAYKQKVKDKNLLVVGEVEIGADVILTRKNIPVCQHYIKWDEIGKMSKKSDLFNQAVFDFVKQYIKQNAQGDNICKSCNELVQIQKYGIEGTYVEELDMFLTTSMVITLKLDEMAKYSSYTRAIRNIEKNIEKFAYGTDIIAYVGNLPATKLKRKLLIKDVIDLILIHTEWLRKQPKNRIELFGKKYGTSKDFTNLFFFTFEDNIFLTSSTDTDYYKIIKYNNILAYLLFLMISELNPGQIISFRDDNKFNYLYFQKIKNIIFDELYIRVNEKEKKQLSKLPLFSYILYYLAGMLVGNKIWLYNDSAINENKSKADASKEKIKLLFNMHKSVIHTTVDLINTIVEANLDKNKSYFYELIYERLRFKLNNIFNDPQLLKRIETNSNKFINIDSKTNAITFNKRKVESIELDYNSEYKKQYVSSDYCALKRKKIDTLPFEPDNNILGILTNCDDGKFHKWFFKSGDLICSLCNKSYNELLKLDKKDKEKGKGKEKIKYLDKLKEINLIKLYKKYCVSGEIHDIKDDVCTKCKINIVKDKATDKELKVLEKNLEEKTNEDFLDHMKLLKEHIEKEERDRHKTKKIINKLYKRYEEYSNNKLEIYINKFIDKISSIIGNNIIIDNKSISLKTSYYVVSNDYIGYPMKPYEIDLSDKRIKFIPDHPVLKTNIIYFKDNTNKYYIYYDQITLQYIGYSDNNVDIKRSNNNASLKIKYSFRDMLLYLGYPNRYINIYHLNKDYQFSPMFSSNNNDKDDKQLGGRQKDDNNNDNNILDSEEVKENILKLMRTRMVNLKQIITRTQSILYLLNNKNIKIGKYSVEENKILEEYNKKIKNIVMADSQGHNKVFKNYNYILHRLQIDYNLPNIDLNIIKNYIDIENILYLENNDNKLIFYLLSNFDKIIEYNRKSLNISEIINLIGKIINYSFNLYHIPFISYDINKFDFLLINETPYIDETLKVIGHYQELMTQQEIDDPNRKEEEYDSKEAKDAMDIDDYDAEGDDYDGREEALDGYE